MPMTSSMTAFDAAFDDAGSFTHARGEYSIKQIHFQDQIGHVGHPLVNEGLDSFQFVTLYTHAHQPYFASDEAKHLLLIKLQEAKARFRLNIAGYVMLDDHMHFLYIMNAGQRIQSIVDMIRDGFTREWRGLLRRETNASLGNHQPLWETDFKAYQLTQADELRNHLNFIHYDPVRHGLVAQASNYAWSSLPARVHQGHYPEDWAVVAPPAGVAKVARSLYLAS